MQAVSVQPQSDSRNKLHWTLEASELSPRIHNAGVRNSSKHFAEFLLALRPATTFPHSFGSGSRFSSTGKPHVTPAIYMTDTLDSSRAALDDELGRAIMKMETDLSGSTETRYSVPRYESIAFGLQRYLQLKTLLPGAASLPDDLVESLISKVEETTGPAKFDEGRIWGDWQLVWQRNTKQAPSSQKALAPLPQFSNFMTDDKGTHVFRNIVQMTKRRMKLVADVEYTAPDPQGTTPQNRLGSIISAAYLEVTLGERFGWKPFRLPLPLRGKGWLDILYLSDDMRITRGNRGGVFVHIRPSLLETS